MRVTASIIREDGRFFAKCAEVDRMGEGSSEAEAVASLRDSLKEYYGGVEAVAPPETPAVEEIEIVIIERPTHIVVPA